MTEFLGPGVGELREVYFERKVAEVGWFNLSPLERLALEVIADFREEAKAAELELREMEDERDSYSCEAHDLQGEVYQYQQDVEDLREEVRALENAAEDCGYVTVDETSQDDEVDFLKRLVADLEEELAAIDAGVAA